MEYEIEISETCLEEIEDICKYIEEELKAKQASNKLREKIIETIRGLKEAPKIYAKIEQKDRLNRQYRKIVVDNYVILYTIIEKDKVILISHMYYGRKDYKNGGLL